VAVSVVLALPASSALGKDYADVARNIKPSGQYGSFPVPAGADEQAKMYNALTPLFDQVTDDDLQTKFKSEALGVGTDGPTTEEVIPRDGVTVLRDRFNVPHISAPTAADGIWTAGYLLAEDRVLLLGQVRYAGRVAAIDVPNITALGVLLDLQTFDPSDRTEREVAKQTDVLERTNEGRKLLADIDLFLEGINAYLAANSPGTEPWTRLDVYAVNALKGQFLGQGGGREAENTQFLAGLQDQYSDRRAMNIFNDLRQFRNRELPTTIDGKFPYGKVPSTYKGNVIIDHDSYSEFSPVPTEAIARKANVEGGPASNTLQINADRSTTGFPLMVAGPQFGYFYPGFTYEMDMDAGRLQWRGITTAPFPGYLINGRGEDFATSLTSAGLDIIDQYALTLCGGSDEMYRYKGQCKSMRNFNAGTLSGEPVKFLTTKYGSVTGYATVDGSKVAIAAKRSSYGRDTRDALFNRKLSNGTIESVEDFYKAASKTPQTFNSFYMDDTDNALYTSGRLPIRPKKIDPGLLTKGNGNHDWEGFLPADDHPQGENPADGTMVNWNQSVARGVGASDNAWGRNGSVNRVDLLNRNLDRLSKGGEWNLAEVTSAMNAAATQDVRAIVTVPLLADLLEGSDAPNAQAAQMLALLRQWRANGGNRLDTTGNGKIDAPGAAIIDGAWDGIADALMQRRLKGQTDELADLFSRYDSPPGGQFNGWHQYFDRDIRRLLGQKIAAPLNLQYCGRGSLATCQADVWAAIAAAGAKLEADQGSADPATWRADATAEEITFAPINLLTMAYTNRPTGIQQVISFDGGR
jgi:acyl-homoserine lactone acylase PvdQ